MLSSRAEIGQEQTLCHPIIMCEFSDWKICYREGMWLVADVQVGAVAMRSRLLCTVHD
jgi:hypothetical protein